MLNILIIPLFICLNEQEQAPCNTFILFFSHHFRPLGVYCNGNHVGRCSNVGGVGKYLLKMLVDRSVVGRVGGWG